MLNVKRTILENGLRIITVPQKEAPATTVMVIVEAGSKYEKKDTNGISHFLEHMCFKGTKKRPRQIIIAQELEGLGAEYNAFTSEEFTAYFAKVKNELFDNALDVVVDMYLNPIFEPREIEKERGVIIEEINMYEDLPQRKVQELFMNLVYGDQPAGWSVAGKKEVIKKLKRIDFCDYRKKHYTSQATTVVIAGGIKNHDDAIFKIKKYFKKLKKRRKQGKLKVREEQKAPKELIFNKESDQTHLVLGFRTFDIFDKRRFVLEILADILGGGIGSRLFQKIRSELSAAYYVNASADFYSDHGLITMSAGICHNKIELVIKKSLNEFIKLKEKKVSTKELARAKEHLIGRLFLSLETSDQLAMFYGGQEAFGMKIKNPFEIAQKIREVSIEDVQKTARNLFQNKRLNLAVIGPLKGRSFKGIIKINE